MDVLSFLFDHWEYVLLVFYTLEKLVKLSKWTWDDILVDGIKAILLKAKGGKLATFLIPFVFVAMSGCALSPGPVPPGCENSVIINKIPNYKTAGLLLKIGNVEAIEQGVYSKEDALRALYDLRRAVQLTTYKDLALLVMEKVNWVNSKSSVQFFIISDATVGAFDREVLIDQCDQQLLFGHLDEQIFYTKMLQ